MTEEGYLLKQAYIQLREGQDSLRERLSRLEATLAHLVPLVEQLQQRIERVESLNRHYGSKRGANYANPTVHD